MTTMYGLDNKENDSKSTSVLSQDKLQVDQKSQKPRRSVLKEFDPFAPDSPQVNHNRTKPVVIEEDVFEDAQSSLTAFQFPRNKGSSTDNDSPSTLAQYSNFLIPELQEFTPPKTSDMSGACYMEAVENLSQLESKLANESSSDEEIEFRQKKPNKEGNMNETQVITDSVDTTNEKINDNGEQKHSDSKLVEIKVEEEIKTQELVEPMEWNHSHEEVINKTVDMEANDTLNNTEHMEWSDAQNETFNKTFETEVKAVEIANSEVIKKSTDESSQNHKTVDSYNVEIDTSQPIQAENTEIYLESDEHVDAGLENTIDDVKEQTKEIEAKATEIANAEVIKKATDESSQNGKTIDSDNIEIDTSQSIQAESTEINSELASDEHVDAGLNKTFDGVKEDTKEIEAKVSEIACTEIIKKATDENSQNNKTVHSDNIEIDTAQTIQTETTEINSELTSDEHVDAGLNETFDGFKEETKEIEAKATEMANTEVIIKSTDKSSQDGKTVASDNIEIDTSEPIQAETTEINSELTSDKHVDAGLNKSFDGVKEETKEIEAKATEITNTEVIIKSTDKSSKDGKTVGSDNIEIIQAETTEINSELTSDEHIDAGLNKTFDDVKEETKDIAVKVAEIANAEAIKKASDESSQNGKTVDSDNVEIDTSQPIQAETTEINSELASDEHVDAGVNKTFDGVKEETKEIGGKASEIANIEIIIKSTDKGSQNGKTVDSDNIEIDTSQSIQAESTEINSELASDEHVDAGLNKTFDGVKEETKEIAVKVAEIANAEAIKKASDESIQNGKTVDSDNIEIDTSQPIQVETTEINSELTSDEHVDAGFNKTFDGFKEETKKSTTNDLNTTLPEVESISGNSQIKDGQSEVKSQKYVIDSEENAERTNTDATLENTKKGEKSNVVESITIPSSLNVTKVMNTGLESALKAPDNSSELPQENASTSEVDFNTTEHLTMEIHSDEIGSKSVIEKDILQNHDRTFETVPEHGSSETVNFNTTQTVDICKEDLNKSYDLNTTIDLKNKSDELVKSHKETNNQSESIEKTTESANIEVNEEISTSRHNVIVTESNVHIGNTKLSTNENSNSIFTENENITDKTTSTSQPPNANISKSSEDANNTKISSNGNFTEKGRSEDKTHLSNTNITESGDDISHPTVSANVNLNSTYTENEIIRDKTFDHSDSKENNGHDATFKLSKEPKSILNTTYDQIQKNHPTEYPKPSSNVPEVEQEIQSNKELEILARSLNQTLDVEESAITLEINSSTSPNHSNLSGSLNQTVEENTAIKEMHPLNETRPIDKADQTESNQNTKSEPFGPKEDVNTNSSIASNSSKQKRVSGRPAIRPLRTQTQIITKEILDSCQQAKTEDNVKDQGSKPLDKNDDINQKVLEDYKKKNKDMLNHISQLESQMDNMKKENEFLSSVKIELNLIKNYKLMLEKYEETIIKQALDLEASRAQAEKYNRMFTNIESAFPDLYEKYQKTRYVIEKYKKNEEAFETNLQKTNEQLSTLQLKYQTLQANQEQVIEAAQEKTLLEKQKIDSETAKLQTKVKRLEIKISSLENALKLKTDECQALSALYDDLAARP